MLQLAAHDGPTWPSEASGGSGGGPAGPRAAGSSSHMMKL